MTDVNEKGPRPSADGDAGYDQTPATSYPLVSIDQSTEFRSTIHCPTGADAERLITKMKAAREGKPIDSKDAPVMVCLCDVKPVRLEWLWPGRIPLGKLSLIFGDPGLGKSLVTLDIVARVSSGRSWPDRCDEPNPAGGAILLSAEDDINDTVRPRLDAAEADVHRVYAMSTVRLNNGLLAAFSLARDLQMLERAIDQVANCRVVVVDPISAYTGSVDSHKNAELRGLLGPLAELAARRRVAVIGITHMTKEDGKKAIYRATGSLAFVAAARAGHLVTADPDDDKRRFVLPVKNNVTLGTGGLAYCIIGQEIHGLGALPVVSWDAEPVTKTADEILAIEVCGRPGPKPVEQNEAQKWLQELLTNGEMAAAEVRKQADDAGFSKSTIRRAAEALAVRRRKLAMTGGWSWALRSEGASTTPDQKNLSTFGKPEHLRVLDRESEGTEGVYASDGAEDAQVSGVSTFDDSGTFLDPVEAAERAAIQSVEAESET